jgi:hypothetical protein
MKNVAKTEIVKYKGVEYKVRTLEVRDNIDGEVLKSTIKIAPIGLNESYDENKMSVHSSKEQILDASIDHYVTDEVLESLPNVVTQHDIMEVMMEVMSCVEME